MEPLAWLGVLAVVIGLIGVVVLVKGRKNTIR
jgi:drug/metabolite transporter (DMT)-like permease